MWSALFFFAVDASNIQMLFIYVGADADMSILVNVGCMCTFILSLA